ncbi:DNA-binding protein [Bacillus sp. BP-3]|uniref:DNA-binding protein n=1 Tax=Bacillus sp. BP-3 TaxID=3022773 RepID=UPI00233148AC|nr:DNA-binding protein [Bacillus sp. BP-3]MDC2863156.1 DNA-binding protein [Bacillus sp. BP-3]
MTKWINVQEAIEILEEHYIQVSYKTFTDWLRKLEIPAIPSANRKEGWAIRKEDIFGFIEKKRPGLRQILEEYDGLVEDMNQLKQQVQVLSGNREVMDKYEEELKENKLVDPLQSEGKVENEEEYLLYDFLNVMLGVIQELREQSKSINQAYGQIVSDYHFLYKELRKLHVSTEKTIELEREEEEVEDEIIPMINEDEFHELLQAQIKQKIPDQQIVLEPEAVKQLYILLCNKLFSEGENKQLGIIKRGDIYICPSNGTQYKQINRIYNPPIRTLLEEFMKNKNNSVDEKISEGPPIQEKAEHIKGNES